MIQQPSFAAARRASANVARAGRQNSQPPEVKRALRAEAQKPVPPKAPFDGTDERGGVLMVVAPDEMEALRRYWDAREGRLG